MGIIDFFTRKKKDNIDYNELEERIERDIRKKPKETIESAKDKGVEHVYAKLPGKKSN